MDQDKKKPLTEEQQRYLQPLAIDGYVPCQLYVITPPVIELNSFIPQCEYLLSLRHKERSIACLQMRLKEGSQSYRVEVGQKLLTICQQHDIPLIVNDDVEIAMEIGADTVHLGEDDGMNEALDMERLRAQYPNLTIGVSCYNSKDRAMMLADAGADYVSFGACFPTPTKQVTRYVEKELLQWWARYSEIPVVAIGGITPYNATEIVATGVDFIAVLHGLWQDPAGIESAFIRYMQCIDIGIEQYHATPKQY
jgi:thiamine-phosphate pyrophosphorylase